MAKGKRDAEHARGSGDAAVRRGDEDAGRGADAPDGGGAAGAAGGEDAAVRFLDPEERGAASDAGWEDAPLDVAQAGRIRLLVSRLVAIDKLCAGDRAWARKLELVQAEAAGGLREYTASWPPMDEPVVPLAEGADGG